MLDYWSWSGARCVLLAGACGRNTEGVGMLVSDIAGLNEGTEAQSRR